MAVFRRLVVVLLCLAAEAGGGTEYYVSPAGSDENAGSKDKPFATIQKAADVMQAGDTCVVRGGTYRQTAVLRGKGGAEGRPIRFVAAEGFW